MKKNIVKFVASIMAFVVSIVVLLVLTINISSAATVEITSGKLPVSVEENKQVDFSIQIKDYADAKQLTLETSLVPSDNKPIWDFGELNPGIDGIVNRYQQNIALNLSSLPTVLDVSISGKTPNGENRITCPDSDIVFSKFSDTKLKFYEANLDGKLSGIESFELIIEKQKIFEDTIEQIRQKEFDGVIREDRKLFDIGLTTEAQNIANELKIINWPGSLSLFGILKIESNILLDVIVVGLVLLSLVIGYILGSKNRYTEEE